MTTTSEPTTTEEPRITRAAVADTVLFGADGTTGIVSVRATPFGRARVWRRLADGSTIAQDEPYTPWLLLPDLKPLEALSPELLPREGAGFPVLPDRVDVGVLELEGDGYYRYIVLARDFETLQRAVLNAEGAERLWDLREQVYYRLPVVHYLVVTGRSY